MHIHPGHSVMVLVAGQSLISRPAAPFAVDAIWKIF